MGAFRLILPDVFDAIIAGLALGQLLAGCGARSHLVHHIHMDEATALCLDGQPHGGELRVHHLLLDGELVALVDIACRAMDLERIMAGPERDGDLLVLLQVGQRLLEELVGDVDRLLVDDGLHADGGSVGRPVGRCRAQDHVLGGFE